MKYTVTFSGLLWSSLCEVEADTLEQAHKYAKDYCRKYGFLDYKLKEYIH